MLGLGETVQESGRPWRTCDQWIVGTHPWPIPAADAQAFACGGVRAPRYVRHAPGRGVGHGLHVRGKRAVGPVELSRRKARHLRVSGGGSCPLDPPVCRVVEPVPVGRCSLLKFRLPMNGNRTTMKKTVFLLAAAGLAGTLAFLQTERATQADYAPRAAQTETPVADASGMEEVMLALRADIETGEMNHEGLRQLGERTRQVAAVQSANRSGGHYWNPLGPDNLGGRTRCILAVNEVQLITGGVSGGLWRSWNQGDNWERISSFPSAMVASIAMAGNGDLYVGTGTQFDGVSGVGGSGFRGDGIYRSTDNGATWALVEGTDPGLFKAGTGVQRTRSWPTPAWLPVCGTRVSRASATSRRRGHRECRQRHQWHHRRAGHRNHPRRQLHAHRHDQRPCLPQRRLPNPGDRVRQRVGRPSRKASAVAGGHRPDDSNSAFAHSPPPAASSAASSTVRTQDRLGRIGHPVWRAMTSARPTTRPLTSPSVSRGEPEIAFVGGQSFWRCGPSYQAEQAASMGESGQPVLHPCRRPRGDVHPGRHHVRGH